MTKIKITALTDKASDEEILAKLKKIGVKIKDKSSEETGHEEAREQLSPAGETLVEKRVASTIIRRRVQAPPAKEKEELKEEKKETPEETKEGKSGEENNTKEKGGRERKNRQRKRGRRTQKQPVKRPRQNLMQSPGNDHRTMENKRSRKSPKRRKGPRRVMLNVLRKTKKKK